MNSTLDYPWGETEGNGTSYNIMTQDDECPLDDCLLERLHQEYMSYYLWLVSDGLPSVPDTTLPYNLHTLDHEAPDVSDYDWNDPSSLLFNQQPPLCDAQLFGHPDRLNASQQIGEADMLEMFANFMHLTDAEALPPAGPAVERVSAVYHVEPPDPGPDIPSSNEPCAPGTTLTFPLDHTIAGHADHRAEPFASASQIQDSADDVAVCRWSDCGTRMADVSCPAVRKHFKDMHTISDSMRVGCGWPGCKAQLLRCSIAKHVSNCHFLAGRSECGRCGKVCSTRDSLQRHISLSCTI